MQEATEPKQAFCLVFSLFVSEQELSLICLLKPFSLKIPSQYTIPEFLFSQHPAVKTNFSRWAPRFLACEFVPVGLRTCSAFCASSEKFKVALEKDLVFYQSCSLIVNCQEDKKAPWKQVTAHQNDRKLLCGDLKKKHQNQKLCPKPQIIFGFCS